MVVKLIEKEIINYYNDTISVFIHPSEIVYNILTLSSNKMNYLNKDK